MQQKLYLVTGGAGFLGGTICRKLLERGDAVRTFILRGDPAARWIPKEIEVVEGDLRDAASLEPFFTVPEGTETVVIHVAGLVSMDEGFQQRLMDVNVGGTQNIIDQCLRHPECRKLVYISSTGAIPEQPKGTPIREVDHFDPERVVGCYSRSKAAATQAVLDAVHTRGLDASIVFPTGILGPGDAAMSNETTNTILRIVNGEMPVGMEGSFNLADVRDLADGCIAAADRGGRGQGYILGNEVITLRELCEILDQELHCGTCKFYLPLGIAKFIARQAEKQSARTGKRPVMTAFSIYNLERNNCFDSSKAKRELGYHPRSYAETLHDEAVWLRQTGRLEQAG